MKDQKRALAMPSAPMVERNMTADQRRERREQLRRWREEPGEETGEPTSAQGGGE